MDNYIDGSIRSWKRYTVRLVKNHRIKLAYLATPLTTCNNKLSWIRQKRISSTRRFIKISKINKNNPTIICNFFIFCLSG